MSETDDPARRGSRLEDALRGDTANYPGYAYIDRVAAAIARAWASQTEQMNDAWLEMRNGRLNFARAMQMWAKTIETSYDVFLEVAQGPAASKRPAWLAIPLVIPYDPKKAKSKQEPGPVYKVALEGLSEPGGGVDYSKFVGASKHEYDLYLDAPVRVENRIEFTLDEHKLQELQREPGTEYMSLIFRKGQGAAPPLAVIVLRIRREEPDHDSSASS